MTTEEPAPPPRDRLLALRRLPFTAGLVLTVVAVALVSGTAWQPLTGKPWFPMVGFGVPTFSRGSWWTLVTGSLLAVNPPALLLLLLLVVAGVGLCEWLVGTRRTAAVTTALQAGGVLGGIGVAWLLARSGLPWGVAIAGELDAGFSAGALGAAVVGSAFLRQPWRWRARLAVFAVVLTSLVFLGYLADVIHCVAILIALPLGTRLAGRPVRLAPVAITRVEVRKLSAAFFVLAAVLGIAGTLIERVGPFGAFGGSTVSGSVWAGALLDLVVAGGLWKGRRSWWRLAVVLTSAKLAIAAVATVAFAALQQLASWGVLVLSLALTTLQLLVLVIGRSSFRNPGRRARSRPGSGRIGALPAEADRSLAIDLLREHGSANRLSWISTWPENSWWHPADVTGVVAYQVHAGVAIALCDPICAASELGTLTDLFVEAVRDAGLTPCLFSSSASVEAWGRNRGWVAMEVASEAMIDLPGLAFRGKKWQDVRTALNQAAKLGVTYTRGRLTELPRSARSQLEAISGEWVGDKGLPEMGFTLGGLEEAADPRVWVSLATAADGTVQGFTSWLPAYGGAEQVAGWTLDVMRRRGESFRYTMEFLIASACLEFQAEGYQFVSLSGAPLARSHETDDSALDGVVSRLAEAIEPFYGFGSLDRFKAKFLPRHEPLFLVAPDEAAIALAGVAVARAYLADADPLLLIRSVRPR